MRRLLQFFTGLIGIVVLLAIVEFLPAPRKTFFWDRTYDTGHVLIFGIGVMMALTMARAFFGLLRKRWQYGASCLLTFALGLVVEIWQSTHGRTAEWIDVYSDAVGILAFAAIYAMLDKRIANPRTGFLRRGRLAMVAAAILICGLIPYLQVVDFYRVRYQLFPRLVDYEEPWYPNFYSEQSADFSVVDYPPDWPSEERQLGKVARLKLANAKKYPGFVFREPYSNWSGHQALEIDVLYAELEARPFVFRVHDIGHNDEYDDRFNTVFTLQPGYQTLRFTTNEIQQTPSGRLMDLSRIESFALFTFDLDKEATLFLGDMRLTP